MTRPLPWLAGGILSALGLLACADVLGLNDLGARTDDANGVTAPIDAGGANEDASDASSDVAVSPRPERDAGDTWTTLAPMRHARSYLASAAIEGTAYVIGGIFDGYNPSYAVEAYAPLRDAWVAGSASPRPRWGAAIAVLKGKIYTFGGSQADNANAAIADVGIYDPASDRWAAAAPMAQPRTFASAVVIADKAYVIGGYMASGRSHDVGIYDPGTGDWTAGAAMPTQRDHASTGVSHGAAYVIGGISIGFTPTGAVETYDPVANAWTTRAPMPTPRFDATCAEVNGILYVIGGDTTWGDNRVATAAVEAYDPATDTWTRKADMTTPRAGLTSFVIDGRIYVAGGRYALIDLSTLEVYTP